MTQPQGNGHLLNAGLDLGGPVQDTIRRFSRVMAQQQGQAVICIGLQANGEITIQTHTPDGLSQAGMMLWLVDKLMGEKITAGRRSASRSAGG